MESFHVGFTGTKAGMTEAQGTSLRGYMAAYTERMAPRPLVLHHGVCVGADHEAHLIAYETDWAVEMHPGTDEDGESPWRSNSYEERPDHVVAVHAACPYAERNLDIVTTTSMLLAAPEGPEKRRSGTWSTVRAAAKMGRPVIVFMPDGMMEMRGEWIHDEEED